jgi:hypothetical protein
MKKYEIALMGRDFIKTYEYDYMYIMQNKLQDFIGDFGNELTRIELSILDQDEDGGNNNTYTFCEIDINELRKGEKVK